MSLLDKVAAIKQRLMLPPDLDIISALDTACQLMGIIAKACTPLPIIADQLLTAIGCTVAPAAAPAAPPPPVAPAIAPAAAPAPAPAPAAAAPAVSMAPAAASMAGRKRKVPSAADSPIPVAPDPGRSTPLDKKQKTLFSVMPSAQNNMMRLRMKAATAASLSSTRTRTTTTTMCRGRHASHRLESAPVAEEAAAAAEEAGPAGEQGKE
jgi:2-oxoglutarate dehydrogenase E2 component (dihydrolipoamide succinyltransferase)